MVARVKRARLTYLSVSALVDLALATREIEARGIPGVILEAGTALGGSAIVITAAKRRDRELHAHDTFGMIPPPTEADGSDVHDRYEKIRSGKSEGVGGNQYYGYRADLRADVTTSFAALGVPVEENSVHLIQGLFEDTITGEAQVALAHLDGDWYESTKVCLARIAPRIAAGGRIVIDDYDAWSGCRAAVDEFLASDGARQFSTERFARLHLIRH